MDERWRVPAKIEAIEHDPQNVLILGERQTIDVDVTVSRETHDRMREGRMCAQCYEPQETTYPIACKVCGFPMREMQQERLHSEWQGERWLGPRETLADEFLRMDEENERRRKVKSTSSILLPRGFDGS